MSNEYRERAAECWRLAREATDPAHRASLTEMAQAWLRLEDQAERNARSDLVYETPTRQPHVRQQQRPVVQQQQQQQHEPPDQET